MKAWGRKGSGQGEFNVPHAIAMDSAGRVFVADRGNNRIQIFDGDGTFVAEWKQFGQPSDIFIDTTDTIYVTDIETTTAGPASGMTRGIRIGSAKTGKVTGFVPAPEGAPNEANPAPEGIAADAHDLYALVPALHRMEKAEKK